jgi:hypothetical protein
LFVQGDKTVQLAAVDADSNFGFSRRAFLPAGAINGPAAIVAETLYEGHWLRTRPVSFVVRTTR